MTGLPSPSHGALLAEKAWHSCLRILHSRVSIWSSSGTEALGVKSTMKGFLLDYQCPV
jgi:hypothetical protein